MDSRRLRSLKLAASATFLLLMWNLLHDQLLSSVLATAACLTTAGVLSVQAVRLAWTRPESQATPSR